MERPSVACVTDLKNLASFKFMQNFMQNFCIGPVPDPEQQLFPIDLEFYKLFLFRIFVYVLLAKRVIFILVYGHRFL